MRTSEKQGYPIQIAKIRLVGIPIGNKAGNKVGKEVAPSRICFVANGSHLSRSSAWPFAVELKKGF
jgi:hypothetical protein